MHDILRLGTRLLLLALVAGLLLGTTNALTQGPIARSQTQAAQQAREQAFPGAQTQPLDPSSWPTQEYPAVREVVLATVGGQPAGYVVDVIANGYGGAMTVMVGVHTDGSIAAVVVGANSETPGLGKNAQQPAFAGQYAGKQAPLSVKKGGAGADQIDALTGATITSSAVTDAVNTACALAQALAQGGVQ